MHTSPVPTLLGVIADRCGRVDGTHLGVKVGVKEKRKREAAAAAAVEHAVGRRTKSAAGHAIQHVTNVANK